MKPTVRLNGWVGPNVIKSITDLIPNYESFLYTKPHTFLASAKAIHCGLKFI